MKAPIIPIPVTIDLAAMKDKFFGSHLVLKDALEKGARLEINADSVAKHIERGRNEYLVTLAIVFDDAKPKDMKRFIPVGREFVTHDA